MPVNVIGTLKPKNNGKFPVAEAVDIKVTDDLRLDKALENKADLSTVNFALDNKADKTTTTSLQSQINEIITPVTQDAEVQNARVDSNGKSYSTLRSRLNSENRAINNTINDIRDNTNLIDFEDTSYIIGDVVVTTTKKGTISLVGTSTISGGRLSQIGNTVKLQAGTYYLRGNINQFVVQNKSTQEFITYADTSGMKFILEADTEVFFGVSLTENTQYNKLNIPVILSKDENIEYTPAKTAKDDSARKAINIIESNISDNLITHWKTGYIITNPNIVDTVNINNIINDPEWRVAVVSCQENDTFIINGTGDSNPLIWCFIDDTGNILSFPSVSVTTVQNMEITAPYGATKLVINDNSDSNSYKIGYNRIIKNITARLDVTFTTATEMMNATFLTAGMHCHTSGFYNPNDGGAAEYIIIEDGNPACLQLQNGLFAKIIGKLTTSKLGIIGDQQIDNLQSVLNYSKKLTIDKNIEITRNIVIRDGYYLCIDNCTITAKGQTDAILILGSFSTIEGIGKASIEGTGDNTAVSGIYIIPREKSTTQNTIKNLSIYNFTNGIKLYCDQIDDNHIVYFNNLFNLSITKARRGIAIYGNSNANQIRNIFFNDCGKPTLYSDSGAIVIKTIGEQFPVDNSIIQIFHHRSLNCCTLSIEKTQYSYFSSIICEQGGDSAVSVYISDEQTTDNFFGIISNVRGGYSYPPSCLQYNVVTDIRGKINAPNPLR